MVPFIRHSAYSQRLMPTTRTPAAPYAHAYSELVADILLRHGSLAGHFSVLGPDPWRVLFSSAKDGFVFFLESPRCILAWRGPVCSPEREEEIMTLLVDYARSRRRGLFVLQCDSSTAHHATAHGLRSLWVGHETFIDLPDFDLRGSRREKLRLAINHARRCGVTWREAFPRQNAEDHQHLDSLEEAWKKEREERRTESFLRNDFTELSEHRRYFVADDGGVAVASATLTRVNDTSWYLQDIVRRPDAVRGALEGAIAESIVALRHEGFTRLSNGPLPLWSPEDGGAGNPHLGPIGKMILRNFDRSFRFRGINAFRTKLAPNEIQPLFVAYSRRALSPVCIWSLTRLLQKRQKF